MDSTVSRVVQKRRLWLLATLMLLGSSAAAFAADTPAFDDRGVIEVLAEYEQAGFNFLYSTGVVRNSLKFTSEPPPGTPLQRLEYALNTLGLDLQEDTNGTWLIVQQTSSQVQRELQGRVLDAHTGEPLPGVRIEIADQVLITDKAGWFRFTPNRAVMLLVSHEGYQDKRLTTTGAGSDAITALLEVPLVPQTPMDEIVVVSSRYAVQSAETEFHALDMALLDSIPRLAEDPLRITGHLPGMSTLGVSAKPHIRGGLQDELLVLFNNLELLEPFHLRDFQSVFSSFNPSLIQSIDVYTGGFPARYGDRMSGVMDISPTHRTRQKGGELSLSLLNAGMMLHSTTAQERGDWMVSARRGNLDIITKQINASVGEPGYSDWFGQFRYELNPQAELDAGFIAYNDNIELSDFDTDGEIAESKYKNVYGWLQLHRRWTPRLDGTSLLYYGDIKHRRNGFLFDEDLDNGTAEVDDRRNFQLWAVGQTFAFTLSPKVYSEFGMRYTYQQGRYDYDGVIERGALAEFLGTEINEVRRYRLRPNGGSGGVFGSLRLEMIEKLLVELGLRWDFQDFTDSFESQISPRLSLKYDFSTRTELRMSLGRFYQPEGIHEMQIADGITQYQDVQYADHLILGWHQKLSDRGLSLRTEVFVKKFHDSKVRYENLFNPLVLLPELAADRVKIEPRRARAHGFETTIKYEPNEQFVSWLTYTQTKVEDQIGSRWQPRAWDQGDTIAAGFSWRSEAWTLGATLLWHDGWRTTRLPSQLAEDELPNVRRNAARLKNYLSLDLHVARQWRWPNQSLTAFLDVTNVLSRRNVGGVEYDVEEDEDVGGFVITAGEENLLPLVPSIGVRWQF
jgi:hypothetical protein